jgi:hypothetical protein
MPYRPGEAPETPEDLPSPRRPGLQEVKVRALDPGRAVHLKVVVNNKGTARVDGGLFNVCVPTTHDVPDPVDGRLRKLLEPEWTRELDPELKNDVECWLLYAERDFAPDHAIVMRMTIEFARTGTWPIYLCLDGEPNHHRKTIVQIETYDAP